MKISDAQLIDLLTRRNLDPTDSKFISGKFFQAFLRGELAARSALQTGPIINLRPFVQAMIKAGYHAVTDTGQGMKAAKYRKLWPSTVQVPEEYVGRFDSVLLVDRTILLEALLERGNIHTWTAPSSCTDIASTPTYADGTPITRYIAFVSLGEKNLDRSVKDCCSNFVADEVGLVSIEGLHLPVQHETYLRRLAVDLPGSRSSGKSLAPNVLWLDLAQPRFSTPDIRHRNGYYGSASRGSRVIPVT